MKKMMMTMLSLWLFYEAAAQNEPYYGGNGDGHAGGELVLYTPANPSMFYAYFGGNGDGHAANDMSLYTMANPPQAYAYFGGNGDGHTMNEMALYNMSNPPQAFAYFGGDGDGYTGNEMSLYTMASPPQQYVYFGGNGDGYAGNEIVPYNHTNPQMFYAYFGGNGDGYTGGEQLPYNMSNPAMFYAYFGGNGDGFAGDLLPLWIHPLSVKLLSFEGKAVDEQSLLEWKTAEEKDIDHFNLERSGDGRTYKRINTQQAIGKENAEARYEYLDTAPLEGNNYYRLHIAEKSGKSEYSQVVLLYFRHGGESVSVFPNPAQQTLHVKYTLGADALIRIIDMRGVTIVQQQAASGSNTLSFPLERFAAGTYMLQIVTESGFEKTVRFVKQ